MWFRPLLLNTVTGGWCNLLRVRKRGVLSRHRHPMVVVGYVIKGAWRYLEHDWVATRRQLRLRAAGRDPHAGRPRRLPRDDHVLQHPRRDDLRRRATAGRPATRTCSPRSRCAGGTTRRSASARATSTSSYAKGRRTNGGSGSSRRPGRRSSDRHAGALSRAISSRQPATSGSTLGVAAFVADAALAERELVLRVHQRRGLAPCARGRCGACGTCGRRTISSYSSALTVRPTSSASSSRITRRSQTPLRHSAIAINATNGRKSVSSTALPARNASKKPDVRRSAPPAAARSPAAAAREREDERQRVVQRMRERSRARARRAARACAASGAASAARARARRRRCR